MSIKTAKPADNYEGLKTQFFALKNLLLSREVEIEHYQKRIKEFRIERIIQLEAELQSEREMNSILTQELDFKNKSSSSNEPKGCQQEWVENICDNCEFNNYTMVGHPGGSSVHSAKKHYCKLGYWEEDF